MRFRFPEITITRLFIWIVTVPTIYVFLMVAYMHSDSRDFKVTQEVYFLVERDGKPLGEMVFGLFGEAAPRTVRNFVTFATKGYKGKKYQGSKFHRVVKKFMIQGGDVVSGDGKGSLSIYGETFADEKMEINHSTQGMLSMANKGPNTNGCQFFITTIATPWLDGHHVVFGKLVKGEEVMRQIEDTATDWQDRPLKDIVISKSGRRPFVEAYYISNNPYNLRDWMKTMTLPIGSVVVLILVYHKCMKIFDAASGDDEDKTKKAKKETEKAKKAAEKKRKSRKEEGNETEEETMAIETEEEEEQEEEEKVGEEAEGKGAEEKKEGEKKEVKEKAKEKTEEVKKEVKEKEKKEEGLRKRIVKGDKTGEKK